MTTKDRVAEALQSIVKEVADPKGLCIGTLRTGEDGEFKGRFAELATSLAIEIETSPPYVPQGNSIAERGFGTIIGAIRIFPTAAPHLPDQLWGGAVMTAVYLCNRTPTAVLGGKAPLELWNHVPLGSLKHDQDGGCAAYMHIETRYRSTKLTPRAKKYFLIGCNSHNRTWRLWDPMNETRITLSPRRSRSARGRRVTWSCCRRSGPACRC